MSLPPLNLTLSTSSPSFHPTITLHLQHPSSSSIPSSCNLRAELSLKLPDEVLLDPDELEDKFAGSAISSYTLRSTEGKGRVKVDIERPSFELDHEDKDSVIIDLEISTPQAYATIVQGRDMTPGELKEVNVEIPLHGRYLAPTEEGERAMLFPKEMRGEWKCKIDPLTTAHLPLISHTSIYITLPTGKHSHQPYVEIITPIAIWYGWGWLVYKIFNLRSRISYRKADMVKDKKDL
ncbi:hypothetical protein L486_01197 [Kwoniella mangroviensis CBS 10435]|uniref:Protein PBN1 n=1 Tax=Kwoniella mangroviensis CBS 10435 TaxID=1331196 RepID=A0A1B9J178_9TREE|nr:hypothetical protein L486_01197 [Kwoniella mangroviensis CBS 10435]